MRSSLDAFAPWLRSGFRLCIARDSLNNNRGRWSDLSIILQFLNISSVKLVFIVFVESGKSSIKADLMCRKCSKQLMWALILEFSRVLCYCRPLSIHSSERA
jgi:hypothetical protein